MIRLTKYDVVGWEHAIRGLRNPMNSWAKSDSVNCLEQDDCENCPARDCDECFSKYPDPFVIGPNDHELMMKLRNSGTDHRKFMRQIFVYVDILAPLYWWKEFDTYKVGTTANSCSTMHKIHAKEFTMDDFSCEHLLSMYSDGDERLIPNIDVSPEKTGDIMFSPHGVIACVVLPMLNNCRDKFLETKDKKYWWQMIQLLPSSYNQLRTVTMNYEVLANMYKSRKNHKLDEWREFCTWIESLPYSELITGKTEETGKE